MRVAFFVIVISISVSAFARIIVNEGEEFEPRFMLSGDSRIPPSLASLMKSVGYISRNGKLIGAAFVVSTDGLIMTNAHVAILACHIGNCSQARLVFMDSPSHFIEFSFKILQKSNDLDIALLKVMDANGNLPMPLPWSNRDKLLENGSPIYIVACHYNGSEIEQFVSAGHVVSNEFEGQVFKPSYEHDADTLRGFSGAPVFAAVIQKWQNEQNGYEVVAVNKGHNDRYNLAIPTFLAGWFLQT